MKTIFKLSIISLMLLSTIISNAQLPKIDKSKIPSGGKVKTSGNNNQTPDNKTENSNQNNTNSKSGNSLSAQEQDAWYNFYNNITQECESRVWIDGLYDGYFMSMIGLDFDKLNNYKWLCVDLANKIEADKKKSPETFKFYGNKTEMPNEMEFGGPNNDALPSKLKWTNNSIIKYYKWKQNVLTQKESVANAIIKYVEASEERMSANADLNTRIAYEYILISKELISYFKVVQGENEFLNSVSNKSENQRLKIVNHVKSKLTGKFHENNLQKVIGFNKKQNLGGEIESQISNTLTPGIYTHIIAYAVEPQSRFGAKSTETTGGRETQPGIFIKYKNNTGTELTLTQSIYCNSIVYNQMKEKFYVEFDWFPDINTINYKSHLEYMPILHMGQYLLNVPNGNYTLHLMFGNDIHTDIGSRGYFTLVLNEEIKSSLKDYLEKLWIKKLESVTFNSQYGEKDQRSIILNWEELKKYGYPEKLTVERTGKVMKPWPKDNEIESFVGSGWGLFKRDDGKYEVIGLGFVQKPGEQKWKWTSIASDMDYYTFKETGNGDAVRVQAKRLGQGYEILPQNIQKNSIW